MKSYERNYRPRTRLKINTSKEGQTLEQKIELLVNNKEKPDGSAALIYTPRVEGVVAAHDVRTNRLEIALDATTKIAKSFKAKRDQRHNPKPKETPTQGDPGEPTGGGEPAK